MDATCRANKELSSPHPHFTQLSSGANFTTWALSLYCSQWNRLLLRANQDCSASLSWLLLQISPRVPEDVLRRGYDLSRMEHKTLVLLWPTLHIAILSTKYAICANYTARSIKQALVCKYRDIWGLQRRAWYMGVGMGWWRGWGALVPLPSGAGGRKPLPITMLRLSVRRKSFYPHWALNQGSKSKRGTDLGWNTKNSRITQKWPSVIPRVTALSPLWWCCK